MKITITNENDPDYTITMSDAEVAAVASFVADVTASTVDGTHPDNVQETILGSAKRQFGGLVARYGTDPKVVAAQLALDEALAALEAAKSGV